MTTSNIRIAYDGTIFTSQASGGISRYFRRLIEEAARIRPEWQFDLHIVDDGRAPAQLPSGENVRVTIRKYLRPGWCWLPVNYSSRQLKIRQTGPAIIHTTLARPFHCAPCPLVTTVHDAIIEKFPQFYGDRSHARSKRWWRWSVRHAAAVFTVSETSRSDILDIWSADPSRVHVTRPGAEEAFWRPLREEISTLLGGFGIRAPYLLYVGHRGEHKNFQVLATAIQNPALEAFDLVLVGGADEVTELRSWQGVDHGRLHHLKRVSDSDLRVLYGGAAALVFPSLYEGFGFPLVEAMSCGTPVVASDIPSSREVCEGAAEFFQSSDPADCVAAILRALRGDKRDCLIKKGLERARLFSWSSCAAKTVRVYEDLIALRSSAVERPRVSVRNS